MSNEARRHAVALRQCAIFAADLGDHIVKAMTDAADFLERIEATELTWENAARWHSYGLIIRTAQTRFGAYLILKGSQGRFEVYFANVPFSGAMDTIEEAKSWAQNDFEDRLRSPIKSSGGEHA